MRETKELFLPWENAVSTKPAFFIGLHQFRWQAQKEDTLMQGRKQVVIFILEESGKLKDRDMEKKFQSIHYSTER